MMARSSQAACHSFFTVRRVASVAARRSTALRLIRTSSTQPRSSGMPGFRESRSTLCRSIVVAIIRPFRYLPLAVLCQESKTV